MGAEQFPSGEWTGFYVYSRVSSRFLMDLQLGFQAGQISGSGWDEIGSFTIRGSYCEQSMECNLVKQYLGAHSVDYRGFREGKGIWGTWSLEGTKGGFHIWPLGAGQEFPARSETVEESIPANSSAFWVRNGRLFSDSVILLQIDSHGVRRIRLAPTRQKQ